MIDDTLALRDRYCPAARVSVLSNATQIHREEVRRALLRVDNNILKARLGIRRHRAADRQPQNPAYAVRDIVERMKRFEGRMILQTMFLRGTCNGETIDNTTEEEVSAWLRLVAEIRPRQVMVYSLDRDTPCPTLEKVSREEAAAHRRTGRSAGYSPVPSPEQPSDSEPQIPDRHANPALLRQDDGGSHHDPHAPAPPNPASSRKPMPQPQPLASLPGRRPGPNPARKPHDRRRKPTPLRLVPRRRKPPALAAYTGIVFKRLDRGVSPTTTSNMPRSI